MIKAVIVDDELSNRNVLKKLLEKFCPDIAVVGEAGNIESGYQVIKDQEPDLVFLDIQMPNGNGFSLLKKFEPVMFQIVFVTSYDQYAISAIKFNALDYLLKPIEIDELKAAVQKAKKRISEKDDHSTQIINLINNSTEALHEHNISIHNKGKVKFIKLKELVYAEASVNYSDLYLVSGERIVTTKTLKEMEDILEGSNLFLRINKSCLVNVGFIDSYNKQEPYILTLKNGKEFEISRRRKQEVAARLKN